MKDINLLPGLGVESEKKKKSLGLGVYLLIILLVPAIMFSYDLFVLKAGANKTRAGIEEADSNIRTYSEVDEIIRVLEQGKSRLKIIENLQWLEDADTCITTGVLDDISSVMPEELFSVMLELEEGGSLSMTAVSRSYDSIAVFVHSLKQLQSFSEVTLLGVSKNHSNEGVLQNYNLALTLVLSRKSNGGDADGGE